MSIARKVRQAKMKESNKEEDLNESYEARFIKDMKNEIEEGFCKKGEEIGMNEMCNNVIDNIIQGKEINELFQSPNLRKTKKFQTRFPKLSKVKEAENKKSTVLFSEKFIKPSKKNYKDILILPLINHKYKCNQNIKFRQGETEKILAYEYYQNSYKKCVQLTQSQESLNTVRANYKLMWDYVNTYGNKIKNEKYKFNDN